MSAPLVGRRVQINGLSSKPELNGTHGVAASFDDSKGRYNVKLDGSGSFMALKPSNLVAADGGAGAGGMPRGFGGMGGMPGGMGGMPGGMGGMPGMAGMAGGLPALLAQLFGGRMPSMPSGLQPQHIGLAVLALFFLLPRLGIGMMPALLLGSLGLLVHKSAAEGRGARGVLNASRELIGKASGLISRATGRPISAAQTVMLLGATVYLVYRYWLSDGAGERNDSRAGYAAYSKGYRDGQKGAPYDPILDDVPASSGATGGGWGLGKMFTMAMASSMVYQMGGSPWSLENVVASARTMNPMNWIIILNLLSSLFG